MCHLHGAGDAVEEIEDVSVVGWEAITEADGFHGGEKGVRGTMIVKFRWTRWILSVQEGLWNWEPTYKV